MILNVENTDYLSFSALVRDRIANKNKKAHVITFGCQQNEADSERVRGMLVDMGYSLTDDYSNADVIVVNTCAIREHAEMKALSLLGNFRAVKRKNPDLIVGLIGCMAAEPTVVAKLKTDFHYISFTIEPNMLYKLSEMIFNSLEEGKRAFVIGEDRSDVVEGLPVVRSGKIKAWVSIMYGCNNFCSYCIVPYVRGRERSRASSMVIEECKALVNDGVREITLLGQNVNSYKSDMSFAQLIKSIALIEGDFIIRFMTSHPKDVSNELIEVMREYSGKIAPYFHLPLQSGSNLILKEMNRTYDRNRYLEVARKLREIPGMALSTDVIIGFPGETEEDFIDTMEILETVEFDMVFSFLYSKREGTRAAKMENVVPDDVKNDRMKRLLECQDTIAHRKNAEYVGKRVRVLVEAKSKKGDDDVYTARTGSNKLVHFKSQNDRIGEFVYVKIEKAGVSSLYGKEIV